jgi:hypothetical protein
MQHLTGEAVSRIQEWITHGQHQDDDDYDIWRQILGNLSGFCQIKFKDA